jgi:hypothetical protein
MTCRCKLLQTQDLPRHSKLGCFPNKNTDIYFAVSKWLQTQDLWGHLSFISGEYPRETMRPTSIRWFDSVRVHPNLEHAAADPHPPRPETTG